jgi:hypothetical protein
MSTNSRSSGDATGPSVKAGRLHAQLDRARREMLLTEIRLIQEAFPDLWRDAERFVRQTHAQPWEFVVAFQDGELDAIKDAYGALDSQRHRPSGDQVEPIADIFYEACELATRLIVLERDGKIR